MDVRGYVEANAREFIDDLKQWLAIPSISADPDRHGDVGHSAAWLASHHGIPFYVAAPLSTIDASIASGADIPIEERDGEEVRRTGGRLTAPAESPVYNPAFDVTPAELIAGIITERGVFRFPYAF